MGILYPWRGPQDPTIILLTRLIEMPENEIAENAGNKIPSLNQEILVQHCDHGIAWSIQKKIIESVLSSADSFLITIMNGYIENL